MNTAMENGNTRARQLKVMFAAIEARDYDTITAMLDETPELLNTGDFSNFTPLHKAIERIDPKTVGILLERGASQQFRTSRYKKALDLVPSLNGDHAPIFEVVRLLIEHGADPFERLRRGGSAAGEAIWSQNVPLIRFIFSRYPEGLNDRCFGNNLPLYQAIEAGNEESVRVLCECGANATSVSLMFPGYYMYEHPNIVRYLVEAGADVNEQYPQTGDACLLSAAIKKFGTPLIEVLLDCGANINIRDVWGDTALHIAVNFDREETVRLLISRDADVHAGNECGATALYKAAKDNCKVITRLLLDAGSDPDQVDQTGISPVHVALCYGRREIAAVLMSHSKHYPAHNPETITDKEMSALLEEAIQANPNFRDKDEFRHGISHSTRNRFQCE
jgi:ankyrin repeat protein